MDKNEQDRQYSIGLNGFASIVDQKRPVYILKRILSNGHIPNAFLFTGIEGVGKRTLALLFASALNCTRTTGRSGGVSSGRSAGASRSDHQVDGCGRCRSCKKIAAGNHPDIIRVKPKNARIKIANIRELSHWLAMKPHEARHRIVLIESAQCMNPEASNSLLKLLEEPPHKTTFVLSALNSEDLLPTIVSRCQHIRFAPIDRQLMARHLVESRQIPLEEAEVAAQLAHGSLSKALSIDSDWIGYRNWLLETTGLIDLGSGPLDSIRSILAISEQLARHKKTLGDALDILKSYIRDLLIFPIQPERLINRDLASHIGRNAALTSVAGLVSAYDAVESAQREITTNMNARLALDVMMMHLSDSLGRRAYGPQDPIVPAGQGHDNESKSAYA